MAKFLKNAYLFLILFIMYSPILVLVLFSFNNDKIKVWSNFEFSIKPYIDLFSNKAILSALFTTFAVALIAAVVASIIGTIAAIGFFKMRPAIRKALTSVTYLPMMNADIVTGISLMLVFALLHFASGFLTLTLAHITFCIPYVIVSVLPKLSGLNPSVLEAARDLGASQSCIFKKIILPEILPGVITGFLLSVTLSIDDFMISYYTTGAGVQTISTYIYTNRQGIAPPIYALSTIIFFILMILMLTVVFRSKGKNKKEEISL